MSSLILPGLVTVARVLQQQFVRQTHDPIAAQQRYLRRLLTTQADTELGRFYQVQDIQTLDQFRDRIPVQPYSFYEPYTARVANGEPKVLTSERVQYLNLTSGSTGTQKLIPVTQRFQNNLRRANLTSIGFLAAALQERGQSFGKLLMTNSAEILGQTDGGIEYGPASVGVLRMGKFLVDQLFAAPFEAFQVSDSLARHYVCLLFAIATPDLRAIAANFPMLILRTCQYLDKFREPLLEDLERGEIGEWVNLDPLLRHRLNRQLRANPARARQLRSYAVLTPEVVWPNLAYIACAQGGTSDFYFERFPQYFGEISTFGAVYSSAEGTFSIYPDLNVDGSVLALECAFFEFIPMDQWDCEQPKTVLANEVQVGQSYRILMTNYSGFYRYDIGDVIEVVGFYNQTPLIAFRHRRGGLLSSTTEKTTEFHVTQVMQTLQREFAVRLEDFCITLSEDTIPARYLVNVELATPQSLGDPIAFLRAFDRTLQTLHVSYAIKRRDQVPPPSLRILAPGSFATLKQRHLERGIPDSQLKFPHISEDRAFLAGLRVDAEYWMSEN